MRGKIESKGRLSKWLRTWGGALLFLGAAAGHTLAFNRNPILWWSGEETGTALGLGALQTVMVWGLMLVLSLHPWVLAVLLPCVAIISSVAGYFISTFQIKSFSLNTVALVFETNLEEAAGFISDGLLLQVGAALLASVLLCLANANYLERLTARSRLGLVFGCLMVSAASHMLVKAPMGLPFEAVNNMVGYIVERQRFQQLLEQRKDLSEWPVEHEDGEMTVVLIVGESARADHFHMNGYHRRTTSKMEEMGVLSFQDVTSCGTTTRVAVPCMLTRATLQGPGLALKETSLISVFRAAGFHTAWLSNQRFLGRANTMVSAIANEAHVVRFTDPQADNILMRLLDESLLPLMDEILLAGSLRTLVVLHTVGSHWLYDNHYPEAFRVFGPVCTRRSPASCSPEEVINSYDNTILYTDHFIAEVIKRVQSRRALVFYVSDHGESLGEEGRWGHGQAEDIPEQRKVPMLVWASRDFQGAHPDRFSSIQAMRDRPLSHDNLFHSLLDCSGVKSPLVDRNLSICAGPSP